MHSLVFPAASRPNINSRISLLPKILPEIAGKWHGGGPSAHFEPPGLVSNMTHPKLLKDWHPWLMNNVKVKSDWGGESGAKSKRKGGRRNAELVEDKRLLSLWRGPQKRKGPRISSWRHIFTWKCNCTRTRQLKPSITHIQNPGNSCSLGANFISYMWKYVIILKVRFGTCFTIIYLCHSSHLGGKISVTKGTFKSHSRVSSIATAIGKSKMRSQRHGCMKTKLMRTTSGARSREGVNGYNIWPRCQSSLSIPAAKIAPTADRRRWSYRRP